MNFASVEDEYEKNFELNKNEIEKLLDWLKQQPHLPNVTELEAILFLHSCHYSMELAKQTIDSYFTMRTHISEFFSELNFDNDDLRKAMKTMAVIPVEETTPEGYRIFIGKLIDFDANHFNFASCIKLFCMIFDFSLRQSGTATGHIIIFDQSGVTLGHVARLGMLTIKKFLYYLQEALPIRIAGFHFVNMVPFSDKILALMYPFMKKELTDVLHLHNDMESLRKFIPLEILPKEYGGVTDSVEKLKKTYENAIENQSFFNDLESRKVNEIERPGGKPKDASDIFGIEGNFKKLNVD